MEEEKFKKQESSQVPTTMAKLTSKNEKELVAARKNFYNDANVNETHLARGEWTGILQFIFLRLTFKILFFSQERNTIGDGHIFNTLLVLWILVIFSYYSTRTLVLMYFITSYPSNQ